MEGARYRWLTMDRTSYGFSQPPAIDADATSKHRYNVCPIRFKRKQMLNRNGGCAVKAIFNSRKTASPAPSLRTVVRDG